MGEFIGWTLFVFVALAMTIAAVIKEANTICNRSSSDLAVVGAFSTIILFAVLWTVLLTLLGKWRRGE